MENRSGQQYRKSQRVLKWRDFVRVQSSGRKARSAHFVLATLPLDARPDSPSRLGVTITTKVDKLAVGRNRLRRRIRELFRRSTDRIKPGFQVVFIALNGATNLTFDEVTEEFFVLLKRSRLYLGGNNND